MNEVFTKLLEQSARSSVTLRHHPIAVLGTYTTTRPVGYAVHMGEIDRLVPSGIIEQWVFHLRRQRSRAADTIWLIDQGFTMHDGKDGVPTNDATARYRQEQQIVIDEVSDLLKLYDEINLGSDVPDLNETAS
jgi:hypothetical protein